MSKPDGKAVAHGAGELHQRPAELGVVLCDQQAEGHVVSPASIMRGQDGVRYQANMESLRG